MVTYQARHFAQLNCYINNSFSKQTLDVPTPSLHKHIHWTHLAYKTLVVPQPPNLCNISCVSVYIQIMYLLTLETSKGIDAIVNVSVNGFLSKHRKSNKLCKLCFTYKSHLSVTISND